MQGELVRAWAKEVYCKQRTKPNWQQFKQLFGKYFLRVAYTGGVIDGSDLFRVVQGMGTNAPGLDGWRVAELIALPRESWHRRADIVIGQL